MQLRKLQFDIRSQIATNYELQQHLESQPDWDDHDVELIFRTVRGVDPSVLVAIVGGASAGVVALITGLMRLARQSAEKTVVFEGKSFRVVVPADMKTDELHELIEKLKKLDEDAISIAIP